MIVLFMFSVAFDFVLSEKINNGSHPLVFMMTLEEHKEVSFVVWKKYLEGNFPSYEELLELVFHYFYILYVNIID
jgi:hypothetical protein